MRIALKVGYIGTNYHGFQIQPGLETIEGELFKALISKKIIRNPSESNYTASGRTDRGVHALGQVIAFDTDRPELAIPRVINSGLNPAIWVWARAEVPIRFDPRRNAKSREYIYIMPGQFDISLFEKAAGLLKGEHDFSNFVTPEKGRSTMTCILEITFHRVNDLTAINIRADHFLWHMVRKIATSLKLIGSGKRDIEWLEKMLAPSEYHEALEPSQPFGLILKNVEYESIEWLEDLYAKKRTMKALDEVFLWHSVMAQVLNEIKANLAQGVLLC